MESWSQDNDIGTHSTYNKGKPIAAEIFISTLKNKLDKFKTSVSQNVYSDKLDDIVNKYNNIYYSTTKMKSLVKSQAHILI